MFLVCRQRKKAALGFTHFCWAVGAFDVSWETLPAGLHAVQEMVQGILGEPVIKKPGYMDAPVLGDWSKQVTGNGRC